MDLIPGNCVKRYTVKQSELDKCVAEYTCRKHPCSDFHCRCWDRGENCCYCESNFGKGLETCIREDSTHAKGKARIQEKLQRQSPHGYLP